MEHRRILDTNVNATTEHNYEMQRKKFLEKKLEP